MDEQKLVEEVMTEEVALHQKREFCWWLRWAHATMGYSAIRHRWLVDTDTDSLL